MGREVRRVPKDWQHPQDQNGHYIPLLPYSFKKEQARWDEEERQWKNGLRFNTAVNDFVPKETFCRGTYVEWAGPRPTDQYHYMPDWPESERTHIQMYEDCTEGTPISPVMDTPEHLARWLADNNASAMGSQMATYAQWLATIRRGFAITMVFDSSTGQIVSGVAFNEKE